MFKPIFLQMEYNRYNIALLCTSSIYFFVWVFVLLSILILSIVNNSSIDNDVRPYVDPAGVFLIAALITFTLLNLLSVFGSLFFVALNQKKSDKWFFGLPLFIVLLTLILSLYLIQYAPLSRLYVPEEVFFLFPVLAAPASALFIKSVPEERRESAKKYFKVARVVSVYAAIIGFMYFIETLLLKEAFLPVNYSLSSVYIIIRLMMFIYVAILLPSIGICLVLMAKEKQPAVSIPKHVRNIGM
jgi:heme/copper-type cytochrome/quinol oxidase subunit 4